MKSRPIIFGGPMVRAILDGWKTQTRRVVSRKKMGYVGPSGAEDDPGSWGYETPDGEWVLLDQTLPLEGYERRIPCPYGEPGDRLWVRETHAWADVMADGVEREDPTHVAYRADGTVLEFGHEGHHQEDTYAWNWGHESICWRPSIYMPRWASRITLEVTNIRVERVQDIDSEDAIAEGMFATDHALEDFIELWDSINARRGYAWESDPWVWVVEFKVVTS